MPSGKTHDKIAWISLPLVLWGIFSWFPLSMENTLWLLGGYFVGSFYLTPDLDTHSQPYRRWGLFRWIWLPYQRFVAHRSWISHGVVVGPILQCLYLTMMLGALGIFVLSGLNALERFQHASFSNQSFWAQNLTASISLAWVQLSAGVQMLWKTEGQTFLSHHQTEALSVFWGLCLGSLIHIVSDAIFSTFKSICKSTRSKRKSYR